MTAETSATPCGVDVRRRELLAVLLIGSVAAITGGARTTSAQAAEVAASADWQVVLRTLFPHTRVDDALYAIPADALLAAAAKDPQTGQLLAAGWRSLNDAAGGDFAAAPADVRTRALASIAGTPLFTVLRQTTVFTFYAAPKVWDALGYEGDAWRFGGYLGKGVDTIDWLPDPPTPDSPPDQRPPDPALPEAR